MASKDGRDKTKLESIADTGHFYTTTRSKYAELEKMKIMRLDPAVRKHAAYEETKIK